MLGKLLKTCGRLFAAGRMTGTDRSGQTVGSDPPSAAPESYSHGEAAQLLLGLIEAELVLHDHVPANLNVVADEVFPLIPVAIRGVDTPVNRAEFAHVLHRGILFLDAVSSAVDERTPKTT